MNRLFYEVLVIDRKVSSEGVLFRKKSNWSFVSPLGTLYFTPLLSESLVVCGYEDDFHDGQHAFIMALANQGTSYSEMGIEVQSLSETRADLIDDDWIELGSNGEVILTSDSTNLT